MARRSKRRRSASAGSFFDLAADGTLLWTTSFDAPLGPPSTLDGVVYVADTAGTAYAVDAADGIELWSYTTGGGIYAGVAVGDGIVAFESDDGSLYALNTSDGSFLWSAPAGGGFDSIPAIVGDIIYAADANAGIVALDARDGTQLWRFQSPSDGYGYRNPVVSGEMVFAVRDDGSLVALAAAGVPCSAAEDLGTPDTGGATQRYLIVGGTAELRSAPASTAGMIAPLPDGTFVEGLGPPAFADTETWWPVREPIAGAIGFVPETVLQPLTCQTPLTFELLLTEASSPAASPDSSPVSNDIRHAA